ncbi:MAG: DNA mismatch repair endonuclease MutL [Anaerolineales bacterium]|nr:DNA mismatch repair endonuclease MutL [Anaerolineales bacterium]
MPIQVLSDELASQIAAGEVVERPASVVKELLENALDAGARTITVTIEGGGRQLIRVADDGLGIPAGEVELAFARHATSKLAVADDLFHIHTLGFRGEALASIASVSRVGVVTRARGEDLGTQLRLEGGALVSRAGLGAPPGTVISVENLFYNVPARLKFLKSETSERGQIATLLSRYALAYPAVRFKLLFDNRTSFQSNGSGDVREALVAAYGVEIARQLIAIDSAYGQDQLPLSKSPEDEEGDDLALREPRPDYAARDTIRVAGFISPPALNRSNRRDITLFVNGRWIQDIRLSTAVLQAYHTMLMVGRYPLAVIMLYLPAEDVDVNVHPTKAEVRFRSADAVFSAVERTVRRALTERAPVPQIELRRWDTSAAADRLVRPSLQWGPEWGLGESQPAPGPASPAALTAPGFGASPQPSLPAADVPLLRTIGQVGAAYIVAEGPDGLYLIDQHAAHERILYEAFSVQRAAAQVVSQALLEPAVVEVPAAAAALLAGQIDVLNAIGFAVEHFGGNQFLVRSLPTVLGKVDPAKAVRVLVEEFEEDETPLAAEVEARLIARVCKRAAVKAGQVLTPAEMGELTRQLERCQSPRTCPHGRPTMIFLSVDTLEKQFGRKG